MDRSTGRCEKCFAAAGRATRPWASEGDRHTADRKGWRALRRPCAAADVRRATPRRGNLTRPPRPCSSAMLTMVASSRLEVISENIQADADRASRSAGHRRSRRNSGSSRSVRRRGYDGEAASSAACSERPRCATGRPRQARCRIRDAADRLTWQAPVPFRLFGRVEIFFGRVQHSRQRAQAGHRVAPSLAAPPAPVVRHSGRVRD